MKIFCLILFTAISYSQVTVEFRNIENKDYVLIRVKNVETTESVVRIEFQNCLTKQIIGYEGTLPKTKLMDMFDMTENDYPKGKYILYIRTLDYRDICKSKKFEIK